MEPFDFMGRKITVNGSGAESSPFLINGTGYSPSLAAEIETYILDKCLGIHRWNLVQSRLKTGEKQERLAILKVNFLSELDEVLEAEIWFDVNESFTR